MVILNGQVWQWVNDDANLLDNAFTELNSSDINSANSVMKKVDKQDALPAVNSIDADEMLKSVL